MNATRDVFISYGHADQSWVRTLANNLHQSGLDVFFDEWTINPGDVLVHKLEEGLRTARNGIVVVSASLCTSTSPGLMVHSSKKTSRPD